jgi:hypothetical protein
MRLTRSVVSLGGALVCLGMLVNVLAAHEPEIVAPGGSHQFIVRIA